MHIFKLVWIWHVFTDRTKRKLVDCDDGNIGAAVLFNGEKTVSFPEIAWQKTSDSRLVSIFFFYYLHCDFESMIEKCSAKFHRFESIMADSSQNQAQAKVRLMKKMNIIKSESSLYGALCISEQSTLNINDK